MDDTDPLSRAFSALSRSYDSSDSSSLPADVLDALHDAFGSFRKTHPSHASTPTADIWEDLAKQGISLASLVHGLVEAMDKGGKPGLTAADIYLGFMLAPGSPLYSLFSQLAFDSLLRCIRNACKPIIVTEQGSSSTGCVNEKSSGTSKRAKRKAKGMAEKQELHHDDGGFNAEPSLSDSDFSQPAFFQMVLQLLARLRSALQILHLKEHQESLRSLIELLIELPHLLIEMQPENDGSGESRSRKAIHCSSASRHSPGPKLCFELMKPLFEPAHGCPMDTAVLIMKSLAPSILLTRTSGNYSHRCQIRELALHFVTELFRSSAHQDFRSAMLALPRYLAMKAPEKAEPRALAVESVMTLVKELPLQDQRKFSLFVSKLSHGKPRHRLFAVDLAFCLLSELPDPLGLDNVMEDSSVSIGKHGSMGEEEIPEDNEVRKSKDKGNVEDISLPDISSTRTNIWWGIICLETLLHRCSDKVPAIRARALHNVAQIIELISSDIRNRGVLQNLLGFGTMETSKQTPFSIPKSNLFNSWQTPHKLSPNLMGHTPSPTLNGPGPSPITPGVVHGDLGSLMRRRCLDNKVAVRKSALFLIAKSASLLGKPPEEAMLVALGGACSDPMVSIRKTALAALTEMVRKFPAVMTVVSEWFQSALPLVMDNESNIQEECINIFEELVIDRISAVATLRLPGCGVTASALTSGAKSTPEQELERLLPSGILTILKAITEDSAIASCIKRVCAQLGKKGRIRAGIVIALQNIITAWKTLWCSYNKECTISQKCWAAPSGAWLLLSEVSVFIPKAIGWEFLRMHWQILDGQNAISTPGTPKMEPTNNDMDYSVDRVHLLQTITNVAVELPPDAAADLAAELLERLELFDMDPMEVGAHVKALHVLCLRKATSEEEGNQLVSTWVDELLEKAGRILELYLAMRKESTFPQTMDSQQTSRSGKIKKRDGRNLQDRKKDALKVTDPVVQVVPAIFTIGALVLVCPGTNIEHLAELVQQLIASTGRCFDSSKCHLTGEIECSIHAHAWLALGKICLGNQDLAKRCVPIFIQELDNSSSAAVRNNIMVVMTDFCIRYTSLIDGYILQLTKSLRDSCEIVRRQGFVLLAQLLQKDYLKWRGTLFHRFLLALVDDSEKIRQLASFLFGSILKTKAPLLAYNSFVETIFVLNDCQHTQARHVEMLRATESERKLFSLRGSAAADVQKRMQIYECLLRQMAPEHILATTAKLCADILATAADGMLDLSDPTARCVLEDSLKILASKEMRIGSNKGAVANCDGLDGEEDGAAAFAAAKGRVVTQLAKRNLVQNAIPIFIELKRLLESRNSPLTGLLMECMRVMLKEYKNEIEEILVADKQLQKEIMYDMQKHEAAKAKAKAVAAASIVLSPTSAVLQPKNTGVANAPSVQKTAEAADNAKRASDGKENASCVKGKSVMHEDSKTDPAGTHKRKTFMSPEASAHVRWLDHAATPEIPVTVSRHAREAASSGLATTPINAYYAREAMMQGECSEHSKLASAVANVAAEVTAAAVLDEVARGAATPLQAMSIPKLHALVPSTVKKASFLSRVANVDASAEHAEEEDIGTSLASVRRRQSFSSIDVPPES